MKDDLMLYNFTYLGYKLTRKLNILQLSQFKIFQQEIYSIHYNKIIQKHANKNILFVNLLDTSAKFIIYNLHELLALLLLLLSFSF